MFHVLPRGSGRRTAAAITGLLAAAALGAATPAHAAGSLAASADCEGNSAGKFVCAAIESGGVAPYSYTWVAVRDAIIIGGSTGPAVSGRCTLGQQASINLTVTDSTGASVTAPGPFSCSGIPT
jgi:hypothetical protein